ncbi:MAG: DUF6599 family protein [Candidatus Aminicenantales bacterium]
MGRLTPQTPELPLRAFLPGPKELPDWEKDGEPQHFAGEDLFNYIDGGAEIYFEYGFRQVIVQDYRAEAGGRLSLEIFEMNSPESAYGIYTFKTSRRGKPVPFGDDGQLADYYLNLRKGPFLVTITGLDPAAGAQEALLALARTVEPKIGPAAARPILVSRLPADGLEIQNIKYFKGTLALFNSYPFFRKDVFAFSAGVKGDYERGYSLYVFEYPDAPAAQRRFADSGQSFAAGGKYKEFAEGPGIFQVKDDRDKRIFATAKGRYILLLVGSEDEAAAGEIFRSVQ